MQISTMNQLDRALELIYGGCVPVAMTRDGGLLCESCITENRDLVEDSIQTNTDDGWQVTAVVSSCNLENGETCSHCGKWLDAYHDSYEEMHAAGKQRGLAIAADVPMPPSGDLEAELHDVEEHARQFSPFEIVAKDLNEHPDPEGAWSAFNAGIAAGIAQHVQTLRER